MYAPVRLTRDELKAALANARNEVLRELGVASIDEAKALLAPRPESNLAELQTKLTAATLEHERLAAILATAPESHDRLHSLPLL